MSDQAYFSGLLSKYDVPSPRYTSYPTVPYWSDNPTTEQWLSEVNKALEIPGQGLSLYVHIPFCESLCTYCGCNTIITRDHGKESPYVDLLLKEWAGYLAGTPGVTRTPLREIHLGGGTPTFLSADQLQRLVGQLLERLSPDDSFQGSVEVDPRRTKVDQLKVLRGFGFQRVSMGVQDFDPEVQRLVNRTQPFEVTRNLTVAAREIGYQSINYDLIYGLPKQTPEGFEKTIEKTVELRPDRIALYSLAVVPWIKPAQRLFKDEDLPQGAEKRALYELGRRLLLAAGYIEIGMDHFALPSDNLYKATLEGRLHRNFMGYTDVRTGVLLGLGVSAISECPGCFHQNEKVFNVYERRVLKGETPTLRGHLLSLEDRQRRDQILKFMTSFEVELSSEEQAQDLREFLKELINDGLVELSGRRLRLTDQGRPFLRNACMGLDQRLRKNQPQTRVFSGSI